MWNIGTTAVASFRKDDCPLAFLGICSKSGAKLCSVFLQTTFLKAAIEKPQQNASVLVVVVVCGVNALNFFTPLAAIL